MVLTVNIRLIQNNIKLRTIFQRETIEFLFQVIKEMSFTNA